jgi:hypothetical protein
MGMVTVTAVNAATFRSTVGHEHGTVERKKSRCFFTLAHEDNKSVTTTVQLELYH